MNHGNDYSLPSHIPVVLPGRRGDDSETFQREWGR